MFFMRDKKQYPRSTEMECTKCGKIVNLSASGRCKPCRVDKCRMCGADYIQVKLNTDVYGVCSPCKNKAKSKKKSQTGMMYA